MTTTSLLRDRPCTRLAPSLVPEHAPARLARAQQHARARQAGPCGARDGEHRTQARESRSTEEEEEAVPIIGSRMLRRLPACHPPPPTARPPPPAGAHARRAVPRGDACLPACPPPPACMPCHRAPARPLSACLTVPACLRDRAAAQATFRARRTPEPWVAPASTVCKHRSPAICACLHESA